MNAEKTNWYDESLNKIYGHNNDGLVYGINYIENDETLECFWFKTENERNNYMERLK